MTWTYASTAPFSCSMSIVRLKVGDTSSGRQLLQDEEILGLLSAYPNATRAAAAAAQSIAAYYASRVDKSAGRLSIQNSQAATAYEKLAKRLLSEVGLETAPYAGGISIADKEIDLGDADRVRPSFTIGMNDMPGSQAPGDLADDGISN